MILSNKGYRRQKTDRRVSNECKDVVVLDWQLRGVTPATQTVGSVKMYATALLQAVVAFTKIPNAVVVSIVGNGTV